MIELWHHIWFVLSRRLALRWRCVYVSAPTVYTLHPTLETAWNDVIRHKLKVDSVLSTIFAPVWSVLVSAVGHVHILDSVDVFRAFTSQTLFSFHTINIPQAL